MRGEETSSTPVDVDSMTAEERTRIGVRVAAWRAAQNMTALELSEASGVDRKTIRTIERGSRAGQPAKLRAILEALNVPQVGDFDSFGERTRAFIFSTAPIFEELPNAVKDEAQADVVSLLAGKVRRAANLSPFEKRRDQEETQARSLDARERFNRTLEKYGFEGQIAARGGEVDSLTDDALLEIAAAIEEIHSEDHHQ